MTFQWMPGIFVKVKYNSIGNARLFSIPKKSSINFNPYFAVGFENRDAKVASFYAQKSPSPHCLFVQANTGGKEFFGDKNKQILRRIPKSTAKYGFNFFILRIL